jgi:acetoin utilization deacetylase AcuC-like enzyme
MKPHRMRMVHDLIVNYDIHRKLDMCVRLQIPRHISQFYILTWTCTVQITKPASWQDMTKFHTDEYIAFLKNITPDIQDRYQPQMDRCNLSLLNGRLSNVQIIVETIVLFGPACTNSARFQPGTPTPFRIKEHPDSLVVRSGQLKS